MSIIAVSILAFVLGGFGIFAGLLHMGGVPPTYNAVDFDPHLTAAAKSAIRIFQALELYRHEHQVFPPQASDLAQYFPTESNTANSTPTGFILGWHFVTTDNAKAFSLSRKLGWDPGLVYRFDGSNGRWVFDPGDGSPEKTVHLNP